MKNLRKVFSLDIVLNVGIYRPNNSISDKTIIRRSVVFNEEASWKHGNFHISMGMETKHA